MWDTEAGSKMSKFFAALLITFERVYSVHRNNGIVCAKVSKNLVRYRSKNNFVGSFK